MYKPLMGVATVALAAVIGSTFLGRGKKDTITSPGQVVSSTPVQSGYDISPEIDMAAPTNTRIDASTTTLPTTTTLDDTHGNSLEVMVLSHDGSIPAITGAYLTKGQGLQPLDIIIGDVTPNTITANDLDPGNYVLRARSATSFLIEPFDIDNDTTAAVYLLETTGVQGRVVYKGTSAGIADVTVDIGNPMGMLDPEDFGLEGFTRTVTTNAQGNWHAVLPQDRLDFTVAKNRFGTVEDYAIITPETTTMLHELDGAALIRGIVIDNETNKGLGGMTVHPLDNTYLPIPGMAATSTDKWGRFEVFVSGVSPEPIINVTEEEDLETLFEGVFFTKGMFLGVEDATGNYHMPEAFEVTAQPGETLENVVLNMSNDLAPFTGVVVNVPSGEKGTLELITTEIVNHSPLRRNHHVEDISFTGTGQDVPFSFGNVIPGEYTLFLDRGSHLSDRTVDTRTLEIPQEGLQYTWTIPVVTYEVQGSVVDTKNKPVNRAFILVDTPNGGFNVTTNSSGRFHVRDLNPGEHTVSVFNGQYEVAHEQTFTIDKDDGTITYVDDPDDPDDGDLEFVLENTK